VILDLTYSPFCVSMPPDKSGVSDVKLVCLVHARKVDLNLIRCLTPLILITQTSGKP